MVLLPRQVRALNPDAVNRQDLTIINELQSKYNKNILWPILISDINTGSRKYIYEYSYRHNYNQIDIPVKPISSLGIENLYIDYVNKSFIGDISDDWKNKFLECDDTYQFIQQHDNGNSFRTVDVDYLWNCDGQWKALESTTFFVRFTDINVARNLIRTMNRRPSWQGANGMIAWQSIIEYAHDINANLYVVCMNSVSRKNTAIIQNSNAYIFPLTYENLERISRGEIPQNDLFLSFSQFQTWL